MHPQYRHARGDVASSAMIFATSAAAGRGSAHRLNRNMIVFLAADSKRYEELDDAVRHYLAWKDLAGSEERIRDLDLPPQQAAQARKRLTEADQTVALRISASYQWLLIPALPPGGQLRIEESKADTTKDRLAERASDRLRNTDQLRAVQGAENIRLNLDEYSLWARDGHVAAGKLWEYYCQYPYMPRLAERPVLERGILAVFDSLTWEAHGFALATGYDERPAGTPGSRSRTKTRCPSSPTPPCSSSRPGPAPSETPSAPRRPRQRGPPQKPPGRAAVPPVPAMAMRQVLVAVPRAAAGRSQEPLRAGRLLPTVSPRPIPLHPRTHVSTAPCALTRSASAGISTTCTRRSSSTSPPPRAWNLRSPSRSRRSTRTATPTPRPASSRRTPAP